MGLRHFTDVVLIKKTELHLMALQYMWLFAVIRHFQSNQDKMALLVKVLSDSRSSGALCQCVHLLVNTGDD